MHPIFVQARWLALYLLGWVPLTGLVLYLLIIPGDLTWLNAIVLAVPLCLVYAFICLSSWYLCRATPLATSRFSVLLLVHLTTAVLVSLLWVFAARAFAFVLSAFVVFEGIEKQIAKAAPLLFCSGVLLYLLAVTLHYVLLAAESSKEAERREMEARILARESELRALKMQINPHFIFNSLNSISALTSMDGARARDMCVLLADFLRKTIGMGEKSLISVREELALVHAYLAVERIRFGSRLNLQEKIDPTTLECLTPPLLLQPIVENALSHGVSKLMQDAWVAIDISRRAQDGGLRIVVQNNYDPDALPRKGTGTGLRNVRQRLNTLYGSDADFEVSAQDGCFTVRLDLAAERSMVT